VGSFLVAVCKSWLNWPSQFHNILGAAFALIFFHQKKFKDKMKVEKKLQKHFCMKKSRVKCWWNWHLLNSDLSVTTKTREWYKCVPLYSDVKHKQKESRANIWWHPMQFFKAPLCAAAPRLGNTFVQSESEILTSLTCLNLVMVVWF